MFIEAVETRLRAIEAAPAVNSFETALRFLRGLGLDDFGYLLISMPNPHFPKLSRLLPRMASEEIQQRWTGSSGVTLLRQSCAFVRSAAHNYARWTGRTLEGRSLLDFGCGYGRIARLMYYFSDPAKVLGVDPWDQSIDLCHQDGLGAQFRQSAYLPTELPVGRMRFDFIYAFSVFTHLSERAARMAMVTLAKYLKPDGLLALTIRPVEYWHNDKWARSKGLIERQIALHKEKGFAFLPHDGRAPVDGDLTYGDTSCTTEWLAAQFPFFSVKGVDRSLDDPFQYYVFLQLSAPAWWTRLKRLSRRSGGVPGDLRKSGD